MAAVEKTQRQKDLHNRLCIALPAGQSPDLLKELAGFLGIAATQEPAQEQQAAPPTPEGEGLEASGPKKTPKQARVKSQGPYARPGEAATAHKGPRRRGQLKGPRTTAPRRPKPNSYEESQEAQAHSLRNHPEPHRGPIGMGLPKRTRSPVAGATGSP